MVKMKSSGQIFNMKIIKKEDLQMDEYHFPRVERDILISGDLNWVQKL